MNRIGWRSIAAHWSAPKGVSAFTTTVVGGVSEGAYATLNLAYHSGDQSHNVDQNRARLYAELDSDAVQWLNQVHGNDVVEVNEVIPELTADGMWTQQPNVALAILTADCLPILLVDRRATTVAALHAGWRGLQTGIISRLLDSAPVATGDWLAWIGPSIGQARYEVGEDVWQHFAGSSALGLHATNAAKRCLDLAEVAREQLHSLGVRTVFSSDICCYADEALYSYRRARAQGHTDTGRMASVVMLAER